MSLPKNESYYAEKRAHLGCDELIAVIGDHIERHDDARIKELLGWMSPWNTGDRWV